MPPYVARLLPIRISKLDIVLVSFIALGLLAGNASATSKSMIYCSYDGTTWTQANDTGFGNRNNNLIFPLSRFGSYIYAGTANTTTGGEVWRSPNGTDWTLVADGGFGDEHNGHVFPSVEFDGYIYAGTTNSVTGGQIWRSADGTNWSQVGDSGFGRSSTITEGGA